MVGWIAWPEEQVTVTGTPMVYASSEHGRRSFCGTCGSGLFYRNAAMLPGIVDVQSATLDDPAALKVDGRNEHQSRVGTPRD